MNLHGKKLHFMGIGGIGVSALAEMAVAEYVVCLEERRRLPLVRAFLAAVPAAR